MTQNPPTPPLRPAYHSAPDASGDELDALLDSIMGEDPGPRQKRTDAAAIRDAARQRLEQQRAAEQRARQSERAADELGAQIRALALQVQSLSEAAANQAAHGRAIQEMRQAVRDELVATHRQSRPPAFNAEIQLPSLQIKLVLAQAANLLHLAD